MKYKVPQGTILSFSLLKIYTLCEYILKEYNVYFNLRAGDDKYISNLKMRKIVFLNFTVFLMVCRDENQIDNLIWMEIKLI